MSCQLAIVWDMLMWYAKSTHAVMHVNCHASCRIETQCFQYIEWCMTYVIANDYDNDNDSDSDSDNDNDMIKIWKW